MVVIAAGDPEVANGGRVDAGHSSGNRDPDPGCGQCRSMKVILFFSESNSLTNKGFLEIFVEEASFKNKISSSNSLALTDARWLLLRHSTKLCLPYFMLTF